MEKSSDRKNHKVLYWAGYFIASVFTIWHGSIWSTFILTLGVKEFEGARGFAFVLLLPVMALIMLIVMTVLFIKTRNNFPLLKRILIVLVVLNIIGFGILEFTDPGIGIGINDITSIHKIILGP